MTFNADNTYVFHCSVQDGKATGDEYGVWSYDSANDKFVFVCNNTTNYAAKQIDGTCLISLISNRSKQMTQDYTLIAADAATLIALA